MALIALILAGEPVEEGGEQLRATLPIAGTTLLERQAERAIGAGVSKILVLVTTLPQAVTRVIDHINARGIPARPVRIIHEILAQMEEDDRMLLVADAIHAAPGQYRQLAATTPPALLTVPDGPTMLSFERVDATARWAGLALLPYNLVAENAHMPADWDVGSTLLRSAVQVNARRIACDPALFERGEMAVVKDASTATAIEARMMQNIRFASAGTGKSILFAPLARLVGPHLLGRSIATTALVGGGALLVIAGVVLVASGVVIGGAASGVGGAMLNILGRFQQTLKRAGKVDKKIAQFTDIIMMAFPVALAGYAAKEGKGAITLDMVQLMAAALSLAGIWGIARLLPRVTGDERRRRDPLLPDPEFFLLILLLAAIVGEPVIAIAVTLLVAVASLIGWLGLPKPQ